MQFELGTPPAHDRHREKGRHSSENMATTSPSAMDHVSKKPKLADGEDAMDVDDKENRKIAKVAFDHETHMRIYYDSLFPAESMMKWLAYGNDLKHPQADTGFMQRREFCFTLPGDVFVRYQSFKDDKELRKELKSKLPSKIDIGPVFNVDPSKRLAYSGGAGSDRVFAPTEREFVMDIDMTDYDDVRTCCSAADICHKCWPLMDVAVKVIDKGLREDFGFNHLLWVYSGRRGIHCWVCDKRARQLSNEARAAVAEYFSVYKGTDASGLVKRVNVSNPLHPSLERALKDLNKYWRETYLPEQQLLEDEKYAEPVLAMIPVADVREDVAAAWKRAPKDDSVQKWDVLVSRVDKARKAAKGGPDKWALDKCVNEIIFAHVYPRLDVEVSKHMNHLLKAPFCVHPKTGRVCVPMDPNDDDFDPNKVPTVIQLIDEMNAAKAAGKEVSYKETAMNDAVETFNRTFWNGLKKECKEEMDQLHGKVREAVAAAKPLDF